MLPPARGPRAPMAARMLAEVSGVARGRSASPETNSTSPAAAAAAATSDGLAPAGASSCTRYRLPIASTVRCVGRRGNSGATGTISAATGRGGGKTVVLVVADDDDESGD